MIEIWIISFLTDKFMYPCVSFVYLSLLSLSVLLFKIFNFRFHVFLTGLFPHAFWRLSLLQLAKDSHGGEADCKELVNP